MREIGSGGERLRRIVRWRERKERNRRKNGDKKEREGDKRES